MTLAVPRMRESAAELGYSVTAHRGIGGPKALSDAFTPTG